MGEAIEQTQVTVGLKRGRNTRRRWRIAFAIAGMVALGGGVVWRMSPHRMPAAAAAAAPVPVSAGRAVLADFPIYVEAVGTVTPRNVTDVKVRVDSELRRIAFTEGQDVKAGQVLAELDRSVQAAQLDQAVANANKDRASLDNARLDLERYRKLGPIGAATQQSIDSAKAKVDELAATVAADDALVRNSRLLVGFTSLVAPFDGRVGAQEAYVGMIVHASDTHGIVTVTQMDPIDVQFALPQDVLGNVLAAGASGKMPVEAFAHSGEQPIAQGALSFVDSHVDPASGEVTVKAAFRNSNRRLWPGQLVDARILLRIDAGRVALPDHAILRTQQGTQVFVVGADSRVVLRHVTVGVSVNGLSEVTQGVRAGELVVFDGQSRLNPDTRVSPAMTDARAAARAAAGAATDVSMPS